GWGRAARGGRGLRGRWGGACGHRLGWGEKSEGCPPLCRHGPRKRAIQYPVSPVGFLRARSGGQRVLDCPLARAMTAENGAAPSHQILLREGGAEPVVVGDELADELVQPGLEDLVHAAVLQAGAGLRRPCPRP